MWHREGEGEEFGNETSICIPSCGRGEESVGTRLVSIIPLVWYGEEGSVIMRLVCMSGTVS